MPKPSPAIPGQRFSRLVVIEDLGHVYGKLHRRAALCRCDCGDEKIIAVDNLRQGNSQSCGCIKKEDDRRRLLKHGHALRSGNTVEYRTWKSMIDRCCNPNATAAKNYHGRGISICERWRHSFENFFADMGPKPVGLTLERINNDGNYEPSNCKWATSSEQMKNRRPSAYQKRRYLEVA